MDPLEAATYTVPQAAKLLHIGVETARREIRRTRAAGQATLDGVPVITIGRRILVPVAPLHARLGIPAPRKLTGTSR